MELLLMKTRYSHEGCKITTVVREMPDGGVTTEIILEAELKADLPATLQLQEEDTGRWLIGGT